MVVLYSHLRNLFSLLFLLLLLLVLDVCLNVIDYLLTKVMWIVEEGVLAHKRGVHIDSSILFIREYARVFGTLVKHVWTIVLILFGEFLVEEPRILLVKALKVSFLQSSFVFLRLLLSIGVLSWIWSQRTHLELLILLVEVKILFTL